MRTTIKVLMITFLLTLACVAVNAQKKEIKIYKNLTEPSIVSGQMIQLILEGVGEEMVPIAADQFEVLVTQNGIIHQAKICSTGMTMIPAKLVAKMSSTGGEATSKIMESKEQENEMKTFHTVMFTVPQNLAEGEISVFVKYRGRQSEGFKFNLANRPPTPRILVTLKAASPSFNAPPQSPVIEKGNMPSLTFGRGRKTAIDIRPLIDPEAPDSAILVTFRQGTASYETVAKVTKLGGSEQVGGSVIFTPTRYEVTVKAPEELVPGPVQVEARLRVNGQTSEPGSINAVVVDAILENNNPVDMAPVITNIDQQTVGIGQAFYLSINDAQKLGPDPSKTVVILEQNGTRIELKPESNSAIYKRSNGRSEPALLLVRVGKELIGKVTLKVFNPARGEQMGTSKSVPIEIINDVLPPVITKIADANKQEMGMLKVLHEKGANAGYDLQIYDPNARYVTIEATGLDPNSNFTRVQFEQSGQKFFLKLSDYSLSTNGKNIVRLPAAIKPGEVQVTIQNIGAGRMSKAATYTFEVNQIGFTQ